MKIYWVAAIYTPKEKELEPSILLQPTPVLAADDDGARLLAARMLPESHANKLKQVQVIVRPL